MAPHFGVGSDVGASKEHDNHRQAEYQFVKIDFSFPRFIIDL